MREHLVFDPANPPDASELIADLHVRAADERYWRMRDGIAERILYLTSPCSDCGANAMSVKVSPRGRSHGWFATAQCSVCGAWRE